MKNNISISVICPTFNEEKYISSLIDSIISQDYPRGQMEIFFIDGMSNDKTRFIIQQACLNYPFIKMLDNSAKTVPHALNLGIGKANGDYIIRLDAHAIYPSDYFRSLITSAVQLDADNIGGVIHTLPANSTIKAKAIAITLSHFFGIGNSYFRIGTKFPREVDTVPFGCFRREIFEKIGLFNVDLVRNQDDEFNGRILKNGGKIYLVPEIVIVYYARENVGKLNKMFYQYGLFKPLVNKNLGSPTTLRQFFPLLFVVWLLMACILSFINKPFLIINISILALYFSLSLFFSSVEALKQKNIKFVFLLPYLFFTIHFSYGYGYLIGIYRFFILGKSNSIVNINR